MAVHAICQLEKIQAKYDGNIESVVATVDLDNGSIGVLAGVVTGERELKNLVAPATATLGTDEIVLVSSPEINYLPGTTLQDFYNVSGLPARAYHLVAGDIFTVADANITGTTVLNQWIGVANASYKLTFSATLPVTRFIGQVIEKGTTGFNKVACTTIQVLKA